MNLRSRIDLTIAVVPRFLDLFTALAVEIRGQHMLSKLAFLRKAFRRTLLSLCFRSRFLTESVDQIRFRASSALFNSLKINTKFSARQGKQR